MSCDGQGKRDGLDKGQGTTCYNVQRTGPVGNKSLTPNGVMSMYVPPRMNRIKEGMLCNTQTTSPKGAELTCHVVICLSSHSYEHQCSNRYHVNKLSESFTSLLVMPGIK